ncbi:hypothetical protein Egran_02318 [Elaphomyces granulatus]|uniref:Uncharacterized protein n=1 Tax=Elaphomyces granulatus TaxID=519963 RepID=A0A232M0J5_9EURO|nr:hypothetical protein Egran_02318 [Elaphomyces granulatus]
MALVSMDALQCFNFISESLPSWMSRVSDLAVHTATKQAEFSEEYKKLTHTQTRRRKNSSCRSIRPGQGDGAERQQGPEKASVPQEKDLTDSTAKGANTRKRGTEQAPSIQSADGPQVIRTRHSVVVHYDGHTQRELEQVVRDIGSARNNIRKGKMTQLMKKPNLALDMFSKRISLREASRSIVASSDGVRPSVLASMGRSRNVQKESSFDFADKQLESAQSLCEAAAHQFLRSGDCSTELENIQQKFRLVLEAAESEVDRLREEKEREEKEREEKERGEKEREEKMREEKKLEKSEVEETPRSKSEKPIVVAEEKEEKPPELDMTTIEVDDASSEESISIDISAFRSTRFRG